MFRAARLSGDQLRPQLISKSRDYLILNIEQVYQSLVEPLRPEMGAAPRIDKLDGDAQLIARTLDTTL
jgi:hypothetical protein